jgi:putative transposase
MANLAAHIAVGVDMDGVKHVLGIWVQASKGAKFWAGVCAQLANRGVKDVLIVCCDGLTGFPEAIEATWSQAIVQVCVVHLIRASTRFVSYADRKAVAALLRPIYTAADEDAALMALAAFADSTLGKKYPAALASWENAWDRFTPFLALGPALRKIIYTTNSIESLNFQMRKIIRNRGHFPNDRRDQAALAGDHEHRGQTCQRTGTAPTRQQAPPHLLSSKQLSGRSARRPGTLASSWLAPSIDASSTS